MIFTNTISERTTFHNVIKISPMNETLGQRIKRYRKKQKMSQAELAVACGWASQSRVGNYETDKRQPSLGDIEIMAKAMNIDYGELLMGEEGQRIASTMYDSDPLPDGSNVSEAFYRYRKSRLYPMISWVAAGERAESPDNFNPGDADLWLESDKAPGGEGYWLEVNGRSMTSDSNPSFLPGTYVLVQPEGFDLVSGKYYIAKHRDGETTFKQYVYDAGSEYLVPLNATFRTIELKNDEWKIIGRVIDTKTTKL